MKKEITYEQFLQKVESTHKAQPSWRYGQVYYNVLSYLRPQLAELIRSTPMDPFHKNEVSVHTHDFLKSKW